MLTPLEEALAQVELALLVAAADLLGEHPLEMQRFLDRYEAQLSDSIAAASNRPAVVAAIRQNDARVREQIRRVVEEDAERRRESA